MASVIPVVEEVLSVDKRVVDTGRRVRISKQVEEFEATVQQTLQHHEYDVKRVPCDRVLDEVPLTHQEGDTLIVPIVEERLVTTRVLVLVEEIHLTRRSVATQVEHTEMLEREVATVERRDSATGDWKPA